MEVKRYLFQSPYSSSVQVGRADPSSSTEKETKSNTTALDIPASQTQTDATAFKATQVQEVKPTVSSNNILDTYA